MGNKHCFQLLFRCHRFRLLYIVGIVVIAVIYILRLFAFPFENYVLFRSASNAGTSSLIFGNSSSVLSGLINDIYAPNFDEDLSTKKEPKETDGENGFSFALSSNTSLGIVDDTISEVSDSASRADNSSLEKHTAVLTNLPAVKRGTKYGDPELKQNASGFPNETSKMAHRPALKKGERTPTSISLMNTLLQNFGHVNSMRDKRYSMPERELQKARLQIENAVIVRNVPEVHTSIFRNYSMFIRSYELMERVLKVYVYKEGEKPIFHQPYMRGIYASEGWFMKLMETSKRFVVRDPKKAHLFYIPFSSLKLRESLRERNVSSQNDAQRLLSAYINLIAKKHRFWNRTGGADHFVVGCHDWAPKFTRKFFGTCIRALCNTNIASGFRIGKDVSLPVTYVRSSENPLKDLRGNRPSERPILAFFAGGMHGYLRPVLLQHWSNKFPDMKILGPMPRDIEGKERYRELMRSSKFCICARGYEVHTPRVVESIHYGCIPVIISDNYVPPLFEVLNWEMFAVFVPENDVPNLRNILLSIPEERYLVMQRRLKIVQGYFLWHKIPVKHDLFHVILHSIWYNRVFQVKPG